MDAIKAINESYNKILKSFSAQQIEKLTNKSKAAEKSTADLEKINECMTGYGKSLVFRTGKMSVAQANEIINDALAKNGIQDKITIPMNGDISVAQVNKIIEQFLNKAK